MKYSFTLLSSAVVQKLQVAVVGSGPSGCYIAHHLLKKTPDIHVDIYERMPVPFGLVRYGVAPDHPEVKNVEKQFTEMLTGEHCTFIGNVAIGREIAIRQLLDCYNAVVIATGAENDKKLNIPGEHLENVVGARRFVEYYNAYPAPHGNPLLSPIDFQKVKDVAIIGNGNVAMDCARVLTFPYKHFCPTDMNCHAVKILMNSGVKSVSLCARRGVEHSAFTTKEFRELLSYRNAVKVLVDPFDLQLKLDATKGIQGKKRQLELIHQYCSDFDVEAWRKILFRYHLKPVEILPSKKGGNMVGGVVFEMTNQQVDDGGEGPKVIVPCQAVIRSIGYQSEAIRGVPFDSAKSVVPNVEGRVNGIPRLYCSGWIKNGPKGVILNAMMDASAVANVIDGDLQRQEAKKGKFALVDHMIEHKLFLVMMGAVRRIWKVEKERGIDLGKSWEKVPSIKDMIDMAVSGRVGRRAADRVRGKASPRPPGMELLDEWLDEETMMLDAQKIAEDKQMEHAKSQRPKF